MYLTWLLEQIECIVSLEEGSAGTFAPKVNVFNKGLAQVRRGILHTINMTIDSVTPAIGSLYGGTTLTLTGSGFARFGLYNEIKLALNNSVNIERDNSTEQYLSCIPRTLKNPTSKYEQVLMLCVLSSLLFSVRSPIVFHCAF